MSQSLFYWITYSYVLGNDLYTIYNEGSLNPYFIGLPILISSWCYFIYREGNSLNPYFIGLPILILEVGSE